MKEIKIDDVKIGDHVQYIYYHEFIDDFGYTHEFEIESIGKVLDISESRLGSYLLTICDLQWGMEVTRSLSYITSVLSRKQTFEKDEVTWFGEILRQALRNKKP